MGRKDPNKLLAHEMAPPLRSAPPVTLLLITHTVDEVSQNLTWT